MNKIFAASLTAIILAAIVCLAGCKSQKTSGDDTATDTIAVTQITFNADSAFASIEKQCSFGARVPNSEAHDRCAAYIVAQFKALGLDVTEQKADLKAWDGKVLKSNNIIAAYRPELTDRIIICTHWESRPWADADPDSTKHHQPVMAANDGASGVAVMLEVARHLGELKPNIGIDFICFDSEDYGAPTGPRAKPRRTAPTGALARNTGLPTRMCQATRRVSAYCSTWWADRTPDLPTRA